jgi:uncharacterized protein (TIGR00255 family)
MIRSMTGYGEAERDTEDGRLRVEVKTVNHRFFNAHLRTPPGFDRFEHQIQKWLRTGIARGHVSYTLTLDRSASALAQDAVQLDLERARRYRSVLETLREELQLPGEVDLALMSRFGDLFRAPDRAAEGPGADREVLESLTQEAVAAVVATREAEGTRLREDMESRLDAMEERLSEVEAKAPGRLLAERDRLREAIGALMESEEIDEDRLAREVAYLAERWDINEEIVRLRSHLSQFREALSADGSEPVGKRLGFLVQEIHREANTIGSKANDPDITRASVSMKEELERLREQLENVE